MSTWTFFFHLSTKLVPAHHTPRNNFSCVDSGARSYLFSVTSSLHTKCVGARVWGVRGVRGSEATAMVSLTVLVLLLRTLAFAFAFVLSYTGRMVNWLMKGVPS